MNQMQILINDFLQRDIIAYYHGYHRKWNDTEVGFLNTLKNDEGNFSNLKKDFGYTLKDAQNALYNVLVQDLPLIAKTSTNKFTVCVVPRAKCAINYTPSQTLFSSTIKDFVSAYGNTFDDGVNFIKRSVDTPTTHTTKNYQSVDVGITKRTCTISENVNGKNILLIDDIYTKSVNIDEDVIQALYDKGAKSVTFYAIGNTM